MSLLAHLQSIPDPRVERTRRHDLQSILAIALCATIAGADNCVEMAEFGQQHQQWFTRFVALPCGIPSHDTFARVLRLLDAQQLESACQQWLRQVAGQVQGTVAIDGKSVRGSRKGDASRALHMVSAWAADMGLLLGQCKVDGKSNEITAIPELLRLLHLKGCIVTIDAIGCQKTIAEQLHTHGADYILSLKGNQRHMHEVVRKHFETQEGPIGKFIYCASAVQVGNFIEMVFDPKHTDGSVKERMTISVPVQFVKFIARAEGNSTIGFMQPA